MNEFIEIKFKQTNGTDKFVTIDLLRVVCFYTANFDVHIFLKYKQESIQLPCYTREEAERIYQNLKSVICPKSS